MRLQPKLTLGILAASAVPLALAGFTSARLSERALRERILGDHEKLAKNAAEGVARFFDGILDSLSVYPQLRDLETASPEVTTGVLRLAYRSHDEIAIVALLSEDGTPVVPPVYLSHQEDARALGRLSIVTEDDRSAFLGRIPKEQAQKSGKGMGQVVMAGSPSEPRCAVAVAFRGSRGRYLLSADVSLQALHRELGEISRGGTEVVLVPTAEGEARLRETREALSVLAPAGQTGLGVVVTQPSHVAFEHVRTLRQRTMYWLGVAILVAAAYGIVLARSMSRRIANLAAGTKALAKGRWESKVTAEGNDEVTALAHAFNHMADELSRATSEIKEQNEEITRWNQELEKRVQAKTRELERAQELLLRSKSLSQIGTMGAGIAHEINNPLTGVLGAAQILAMDLPPSSDGYALAQEIEAQAQRIRKIVTNLHRLAQKETGQELATVDLNRIIEDAVELVGFEELRKGNVVVDRQYHQPPPALRGDPVRLQEAVIELITNARRAMPEGGRLMLSTFVPDPRLVALRVADTGRGIAPEIIDKIFDPFFTTKHNWTSLGMGLTLVHKIVEDHRGTILVDSRVGQGASFTVTFPVPSGPSHLE